MGTNDADSDLGPQGDPLLDRVVRRGGVAPVFQPVVDLGSGAVVGYEALARGPRGSALEFPERLFAAARRAGRLAELDWACRWAAIGEARHAGLAPPLALFVNAEPEAMGSPDGADADWGRMQDVHCFAEITERALASRPADLLRVVNQVREAGWGVALDDVGAHPDSLAFMPVLEPDIVKLDLRLVRDQPSAETVGIVQAVTAQAERTGAAVVAEGIETEEHRATALAFGARLGQGYLLGRPAPLPAALPALGDGVGLLGPAVGWGGRPTPFELVGAAVASRQAPKRFLLAVVRQLEEQAAASSPPAVVLAAFEEAQRFAGATKARYADLAKRAAFVGALGAGVGPEPAPGVRGGHLAAVDPVRWEWDVVVVGTHFAAAFAARDLGDAGPDAERRYDFAVTFDRGLAVRAARSLLSRIAPAA